MPLLVGIDIYDHYWKLTTDPTYPGTTHVWSTARKQFVVLADATYAAWAVNNNTSTIGNISELRGLLAPYGLGPETLDATLFQEALLSDATTLAGVTWIARSAAEANAWNSVAYGNGLFVAVSSSGTNRVMTSPDGITWTARAASSADNWVAITYGNGLFVAVSATGTNRVMTSPDGITWTARTAAEANQWVSITYTNGLFVAVAISGTNRVMTSSDGVTWTARAAAEANAWRAVTYGNGLFVAVASTGTNRVMTSLDGLTWTARAASEANGWRSVVYGNGIFVAVSADGTNRVMTSSDGVTWTARAAAEANAWYWIVYGNGLFVSTSNTGTNRVMTSPDGIIWTSRTVPEATEWNSASFGRGLFVAVAPIGTNRVMTSGNTGDQTIATIGPLNALTDADPDLADVLPGYDTSAAANRDFLLSYIGGLFLPGICQGRPTLESGVPVSTTDQTGKTTIYFTPYNGNRISLYDGTRWKLYTFSELSLALGTVTSGLPYDVFMYDNAGTLTLEKLAWTNTTTRATTLALQDGIKLKTGALTRRWLCTLLTTSTTATEDSDGKRFVQPACNRVLRRVMKLEPADSWTYSIGTYRQMNANAANQVEIMVGDASEWLNLWASATMGVATAPGAGYVAIGEDSTTTPEASSCPGQIGLSTNNITFTAFANLLKVPALGYHSYAELERGGAGTLTWYGDAGAPTLILNGLRGLWPC